MHTQPARWFLCWAVKWIDAPGSFHVVQLCFSSAGPLPPAVPPLLPEGSAPAQGVHGCLESGVCPTAQLRGFTQKAHLSLESLRAQLPTFPATAGFS